MTIKEPLAGQSYLVYTTWSPEEQLSREAEIGHDWTIRSLITSMAYQPTTISLSLFVAGYVPDATEREEYRRILLDAAKRIGEKAGS